MGFNEGSNPGQQEIINVGADKVAINKIGVTSEATLLASSTDTRRTIWLDNLGATYLYVGASVNTTSGVTGINFGHLDGGSNVEIRDYRGPLYGTVGASTAEYGVSSAGSSIGVCWVGVANIY